MRAIDTNVLVRLLTGDDAAQRTAAEEFVATGAWVSHLVLAETLWVLESVYGVPHERLVAAVELLLDHETLVLEEPDVITAALSSYRDHPKPDFSDFMILEIARKTGHLPLGTFDKALAKQSGAQRVSG